MALRDLITRNNGSREISPQYSQGNPLLAFHREMNRLFDDTLRAFDFDAFGPQATGWPSVEVNETDKELKVVAELPGLEEKDVQVELANGILRISGEKKSETEDKERRFSERYYGRFERRIPIEDVEQDKIEAKFDKGVLTVTLPKSPTAQQKVKRIAINKNSSGREASLPPASPTEPYDERCASITSFGVQDARRGAAAAPGWSVCPANAHALI
jgi:HSP20 family protein